MIRVRVEPLCLGQQRQKPQARGAGCATPQKRLGLGISGVLANPLLPSLTGPGSVGARRESRGTAAPLVPSLLTLQSVLKIPASNMGTTAEMMTAASAALGM